MGSTRLVVATHNVAQQLPARSARQAVESVLRHEPDVVALQEWYPRRWALLRSMGSVRAVPFGPVLGSGRGEVDWHAPVLGGCVVGTRRARFTRLSARARALSRPGRADRGEALLGVEPARVAVVVRAREVATGRLHAFVGFHLVHGVQQAGDYRSDRPALVARHQGEVAALTRLVRQLEEEGHLVVAMGDSNFSGLRLPGLTSAWSGQEGERGTLGRRWVDDVHAPAAPSAVVTLTTASDHRAVLATYDDTSGWG